jgi:hypothetical protein
LTANWQYSVDGNPPWIDISSPVFTSNNGNVEATYTATGAQLGYYFRLAVNNNGCVSYSEGGRVITNPTPVVTTNPDRIYCHGQIFSIPLTGTNVTSWTWTNSNPAIGLPASGTRNPIADTATNTGTSPISGTIIVTPIFTQGGVSCPGTPDTFLITVNPLPTATITAGTFCKSGTTTIAVSNVVGGPINGTFTATPAGLVFTNTTNGTIDLAASTAGTYTITYSFSGANTCTNTATTTLTIRPIPTATISGTTTLCQNAASPDITFTNPMALPVTITYTINGGANQTINVAANSTATVAVPTGTAGTFIYNLVSVAYQSAPACPNPITGSATVVIDPIPTCSVSGPTSVFAGSPGNTYTTTILPAGGTVTYAWTISGNGTITGPTNGSSVTVTAGAAGTYTLTSTVTRNGCPTTCTITVTVGAPTAVLSGGATYCVGGSTTLTVTFTGNPPYSFTYTDGSTPVTVSGVNTSPYTFTVSPTSTTTYTLVSMSDAFSAGTVSGSAIVTVNPLPVCSITGIDNVCPGSTNVYSAPTGMTTYSWSISGGGTISGATNGQTVSVVAGATCGSYTLTLTITDGNGCSNTCSQTFSVTDTVNPVITISPASAPGCNATPAQVAAAFGGATVTDNCSTNLTATGTIAAEVVTGCQVSVTKNWTVTDACGNTGTASQTVSFTRDNVPPVLTCPTVPPACVVPGNSYTIPSLIASDNCSANSALTISYSITGATTRNGTGLDASGIFNTGVSTIVWTVVDECGNSNVCTTEVTISPKPSPIIYHN